MRISPRCASLGGFFGGRTLLGPDPGGQLLALWIDSMNAEKAVSLSAGTLLSLTWLEAWKQSSKHWFMMNQRGHILQLVGPGLQGTRPPMFLCANIRAQVSPGRNLKASMGGSGFVT